RSPTRTTTSPCGSPGPCPYTTLFRSVVMVLLRSGSEASGGCPCRGRARVGGPVLSGRHRPAGMRGGGDQTGELGPGEIEQVDDRSGEVPAGRGGVGAGRAPPVLLDPTDPLAQRLWVRQVGGAVRE